MQVGNFPRARDRFSDQHQRLLSALDNRRNPMQDSRDQRFASLLNTIGAFAPAAGTAIGAGIGGLAGGGAFSIPGATLGAGIGGALGSGAQMMLGEASSGIMQPQQEEEMRRAQLMQMLLATRR